MRQLGPVGRHCVDAFDDAQRHHVVVGALIAKDADRLDRQKHGKRLPDLPIVARFHHLVLQHGVGIAENFELVRGDVAHHPHPEAGAGKGLAPDHLLGQAQRGAHLADLVLEELAQRLDELELHASGQATDVVVGLDQRRGIVADRHALDHIRIQRALAEKLGVTDGFEGLLKDGDKRAPDDLALLLGLGDPTKAGQEEFCGIDHPQVDLEVALVEGLDVGALVLAEEAVVHKHAGELTADGLVQQGGGHRGVDAAGEPENDAPLSHPAPNVGHGMRDKVLRGPVLPGFANLHEKIADHVHPALGVEYLRMKLDAVEAPPGVLDAGEGRILGYRRGLEAGRQRRELVAVRIPDAQMARQAGEEAAGLPDRQVAVAVLALLAQRHLAAEKMAHELHAVANPQHRHAQGEDRGIRVRGGLRVDTLRTARQDDADDPVLPQFFRRRREVIDLRVDLALADATRNDLRELGSEVEDSDGLGHEGPEKTSKPTTNRRPVNGPVNRCASPVQNLSRVFSWAQRGHFASSVPVGAVYSASQRMQWNVVLRRPTSKRA